MLLLKEVRKSAWTAIAKYHRLGSLINRNVIFQLRSRTFENKVSAELISSQASPGLIDGHLLLSLHLVHVLISCSYTVALK